ncbi:glutaredoxin domain-containing protein [Kineococcus glutinatus]|uniref:Glutaredoxin domain-containing protein n=1 Tax=Kineococcus glutinatus TaxID=1070872 RepID=A0ABP9H8D8_9ACTN
MDAPGRAEADDIPEVFWRPGCPFCMKLRVDLKLRRVHARWRNIWEDPAAREFVRSVNGGDETVPTVRLGSTTLTNPPGSKVAALVRAGR